MKFIIYSYALFLIVFCAFSYLFVDRNLIYLKDFYSGFTTENRFLTSVIYAALILIYFLFYIYFLKKVKEKSIEFKKLILLTGVILFFSYPAMLSYDIFNYLTTTKVLYGYHENPYLFTPNTFIGEPYLEFTRASNKIALYGPFWILTSGIPFLFGLGNFFLTLFSFKALALFFYTATSILILKLSRSVFSAAIFALNPLVVIESLVSAHNDIFMVFFALISFYFLSRGKKIFSILSLSLSIFVKYATFFLIPAFIFGFWNMVFKKTANLNLVYLIATLSMVLIFFLSYLREEIYPWYAIWFLVFAATIPNRRILFNFSLGISFGLMLSYLPYMLTGNYFGATPYFKNTLVILSVLFVLLMGMKEKVWLRKLTLR